MKIIKKQLLENITNNTQYEGCTFYLQSKAVYRLQNSVFNNCSFRNRVVFAYLKNCQFTNCGFSDGCALDLSRQDLQQIPAWIFSFPIITELNLSKNKLRTLPIEITQLQSLQQLNLSQNKISVLPFELWQLQDLQQLNEKQHTQSAFRARTTTSTSRTKSI